MTTPLKSAPQRTEWQPPERITREETVARSAVALTKPDLPLQQTEDVFRVHALGFDWDLAVMFYEPADPARSAAALTARRSASSSSTAGPATTSPWNRWPSRSPANSAMPARLGCAPWIGVARP